MIRNMADSPPSNTGKRSIKSPERSTKVLRLDQLSPDTQKDPGIKHLEMLGLPITRQNYLRAAGFEGEPDPESEAMLPPEIQKDFDPEEL